MFENMAQTFNGLFGKVAPGMCRLTMNGNIAVKCSNGYKSYNIKKQTLTNVTNFSFNVGDEMFFIIPTMKAEVGDIILVGGKPKCVTEVNKKVITVIDYENSEIRQIVPERHVFMGSTYYYGKIVSMFGHGFKYKNSDEVYGNKELCIVPTIQFANQWLRVRHNLHVTSQPCVSEDKGVSWDYRIIKYYIRPCRDGKGQGSIELKHTAYGFSSYEIAMNAGIEYALNHFMPKSRDEEVSL